MSDVIDEAVMQELLTTLGGDTASLAELVDSFLEDTAELVAEAQATAETDPDAFRRAVHSLKTTSATFGAMELSDLCRTLEHDGPGELHRLAGAAAAATDALRDRAS